MNNLKKYYNVLKKMNLQNEFEINEALKRKGFYNNSEIFPLSSLHFELTERCNAFCKHCYNNSGEKDVDIMTPELWINFARYIVSKGGMFECLISGGEPLLLGEKLYDIMDLLHEDGTIFLLMTNGYLLNENNVKQLTKYQYHWVQVSIDSANPEYHDEFRQLKGLWAKATAGARLISANNIPLKIAHCITPYNIHDFDNMCDLAYKLGASSLMAGGISLSGRTNLNRDLLLNDNHKKILQEKIKLNREKYNGLMQIRMTNSVKVGLLNHSKRPSSGAVIRPNGDIKIDGMAPFVIGNILKDDFESIWTNKINTCWEDERVIKFINNFGANDRNLDYINYSDDNIKL